MIKLFTENDYLSIALLWERSVEATHQFLSKEDFEFYQKKVPSFFPFLNGLYVYEENAIIKGFIGVSDDNIEMLFVDPIYIGKGIGKQLLTYVLDNLKISKVDVNEQNTSALEFYQYFGFKIIGRSASDDFGKPYPILHLGL